MKVRLLGAFLGLLAIPMFAAENEASTVTSPAAQDKTAPVSSAEFERLKAQLATQQQQIEQLRLALEAQQKVLNRGLAPAITPAVEDKNPAFSLLSTKFVEVARPRPV